MKKIREKFTIVERLIFLLILVLIIMILIPIISDKIEQPKRDEAKLDTQNYINTVNEYVQKLKETDEELFNEIVNYNSLSKFCSIIDEEKQELVCGNNNLKISSDIIVGKDSIVYFSKEGIVEGYKIIVGKYKVIYPNTKGYTTVKRYHKPKEAELKEG